MKPGWLTSEGQQSGGTIAALIALALQSDDPTIKAIAMIVSGVVSVMYTVSRTWGKTREGAPPVVGTPSANFPLLPGGGEPQL